MKALVEQVTIKRSQRQRQQRRDVTRTMVEHSVVEDSRSNGFIERHVQFSEGQTRTLKLDFEQRVGEILPVSHKLFNWLVEHSADIHNKFHVGQDGLTGYRRLKRKMYKGLEFPFGEPVLFRIAGNIAGGDMQSRFFPGFYLWKMLTTGEARVMHETGEVYRTRAADLKPRPHNLKLTDFDVLKGTPHDPSESLHEMVAPPRPTDLSDTITNDNRPAFIRAPKSFSIDRKLVRELGAHQIADNALQWSQGDRSQDNTPQNAESG